MQQEDLGIIGRSEAIRRAVDSLGRLAPTDLTVLLVGESGVGKEVFARALHRLSKRSDKRMLSINCGAIPETLLESELFGHEKGAFTGAVETRKGIFEAADGGTLFLDEIGETTAPTQVKLLRVLESGEFTRVGSTVDRHTDVRLVAATNRDLEKAVKSGAFRRDLYFRLAAAQIEIPPLRERREDIQLLFAFFAYQVAHRLDIEFGGITQEAMTLLQQHSWPGNVRELKNFVELIITLHQGEQITAEHVRKALEPGVEISGSTGLVHLDGKTPDQAERELIYRALVELRNEVGDLRQVIEDKLGDDDEHLPLALPPRTETFEEGLARLGDHSLVETERAMILAVLRRYEGNRRAAAEVLGISERTLYRKLNQYRDEGHFDEAEFLATFND